MPEDQKVVCCNCEDECIHHYFMCDRDDGEFCPICWKKTACSQGVHGEECETQVFS